MSLETKTTLHQDTIDALQDLVQLNIDSRDGFRNAAEHIDVMAISEMFNDFAAQRDQQAAELRTLISANLETPNDSGSVSAAAHRMWMDLKSALGGGEASILSEAERGEDYIKGKYEEVLKHTAGSAVNDVLQRQYAAVKMAHDRVRDMRDAYKS
jgi:uncharacterized protein (TIGR02284 family)